MSTFYILLSIFNLSFLNGILMRTETINIYCSDYLKYSNFIYKICEWRFLNDSHYLDTYDSALHDCPEGFELSYQPDDDLKNKINFDCQR
jgi:hypothetical protein